MAVYRDPRAPAGRVVLGGVVFVDGVTADIHPGPATKALFAAVGVVEHTEPPTPDTEPAETPAPRKRK